jgi:serine/threonine protein kinase
MEFVDGCNLKAVIEQHRQQGKRRIPVKEAVFIAIETCKGLSFAHELTTTTASSSTSSIATSRRRTSSSPSAVR